ncbi:unnamed protein product [Diamesa hyperborea]
MSDLCTPSDFNFPFPPYNIQQSFMEKLYSVLNKKKIGIFESPTGTGKSLSLICASLKFINNYEEAIEAEMKEEIAKLNIEINKSSDNDDWFNNQYETILNKQKVFALEIKLVKLSEYNKKIDYIRNKIQEKQKHFDKKKFDKKGDEELLTEDPVIKEDEDVDEFLPVEIESDSDDDNPEEKDEEKHKPLQIFFCSRTHSQLNQIVGEVKNTIYKNSTRTISLASRSNYCINKSVLDLKKNNLINDRCLELQKSKVKITKTNKDKTASKKLKTSETSCPYFKNNSENLKNTSLTNVMDIEDLVNLSLKEKSCAYYSSRSVVPDSQLIMVPYQILFNKTTREQCGIDLKNNIVIIDEAHNLLDTISQIHTATISLTQFTLAHKQMMAYKMKYVKLYKAKNLLKFNQLIFVTKQLLRHLEVCKTMDQTQEKVFELYQVLSATMTDNINLIEILKFCEQTRFANKIHGYSRIHKTDQQQLEIAENAKKNCTKNFLLNLQEQQKKKKVLTVNNLQKVEEKVEEMKDSETPKENTSNVIRILLQFLECLTQKYDGGRILINQDPETSEMSFKYLLLDPSGPFDEIIKDCRSVVLAGGTMKPTYELTEQLFNNCKDRVEIYSFGHVVNSKSILPITLSRGCSGKEFLFTHANKNNPEMMQELAVTIQNICSIVPGGIVCFFTSYDNLKRFHSFAIDKKIIDTIELKKKVFLEPREASKIDNVLEQYSNVIKETKKRSYGQTGAIIFSVIGGKLSEGMNFSDDLGRCVIVCGLPYPNILNPELIEKMKFMNKTISPTAGNEYYENLCMKAVNQSIGRSIRHINDYATVVLCDKRYEQDKISKNLPIWIQDSLEKCSSYGQAHSRIARFFKEKRNISVD